MRRERRRHRRIPGAPRCKTCLVPLGGPAAPVVRLVLKRRPSAKNPNYCDVCETFVRTHPGGAEVEISMLFADVASVASAGEVLISEAAHTASGSDLGDLERRELSLKGRDAPLAVRVLPSAAAKSVPA